jgi:hypothetical protein
LLYTIVNPFDPDKKLKFTSENPNLSRIFNSGIEECYSKIVGSINCFLGLTQNGAIKFWGTFAQNRGRLITLEGKTGKFIDVACSKYNCAAVDGMYASSAV